MEGATSKETSLNINKSFTLDKVYSNYSWY